MSKNNRKSSNSRTQSQRSKQDQDESMENNELHELFLDDLADVYNAENQLLKALPKLAKEAHSTEL